MTSVFRRALGDRFNDLHPELQRRFGFSSADGEACIGEGVMDRIWRGGPHTVPFLKLGTTRNILFPETGTDIPFSIENYAYPDGHGRETLTFVRTFDFGGGKKRRFDATMTYSDRRSAVIDYLGTHQHLAVDLDVQVDEDGGLHIRTCAQRFHGRFAHFSLPMALTGMAEVHESFDDSEGCFRIEVNVRSSWAGPIFGYSGRFNTRYVDTRRVRVPATVKPQREEIRD